MDLCTAAFTRAADRAGHESTHVMTTVLRGLLRAAPGCDALPALREALVDGAIGDPGRDHLRCWGYRLDAPYGPPSRCTPRRRCSPSTARPVSWARARRYGPPARTGCAGCCPAPTRRTTPAWTWSTGARRYDAPPRRPRTPRGPERTALHRVLDRARPADPGALEVARQGGLENTWRELLDGAAASVRAAQQDGIWSWERGDSTELRRRCG
ncbi:hypothetical protein ACR6C2_37160 [Streptomyces sp. INA 01156]